MSLLSTDISKVKRLSIKEAKLSGPELRVEPITFNKVETPPTAEEIAYSRIVAINPLIEDLVKGLDLVSCKTGQIIEKIDLKQLEERSYSKETLVNWIIRETNINRERAEKGFIYMLDEAIIQETINPELYYLVGSTPF
jgi:hypothetical protein